MQTLLVDRVEPYSQGDECSSVTLRSTQGQIDAFCFARDLVEGERVDNALAALDAEIKAACLSDWPEDLQEQRSIERMEKTGPYAYRGVGHVVDRAAGIIEVLGFRIDVGELPCEGAVEFSFMRVDIR
ncbi:hypothetical protein [Paucibacter sp. DJ2R-2]|uniref:hypothetical protein n=1 Tax=Paucibacter sp. DJ2R-2 TaxID=2893558 RepID=UPI0021E4DBF7|nr:hypothetical protein [Paucibacter sp. DJ2R-2]MCV2420412.1 hypothetical protein [Paucibacter sp. DJ4R-1]MCV2439590.1 hypothetical protein [Paucibacter sp. DJ2R-2]